MTLTGARHPVPIVYELPVASAHPADQQLNAIYVASEYQGRGIGTRLMERTLKLPRVKSAPHLYLDVWNENTRALQFYAGFGFQVIGQTDANAERAKSGSVSFQNVMATIYHVLGIDPLTRLTDFNGRPQHLLEERQPITELDPPRVG